MPVLPLSCGRPWVFRWLDSDVGCQEMSVCPRYIGFLRRRWPVFIYSLSIPGVSRVVCGTHLRLLALWATGYSGVASPKILRGPKCLTLGEQ